jgi:predicted transcriptional regulator
MERQSNFTCRVDADLKQAFLRAAKANDRPASVLIRDFMRDYVQQSMQGKQTNPPFDHQQPNKTRSAY